MTCLTCWPRMCRCMTVADKIAALEMSLAESWWTDRERRAMERELEELREKSGELEE